MYAGEGREGTTLRPDNAIDLCLLPKDEKRRKDEKLQIKEGRKEGRKEGGKAESRKGRKEGRQKEWKKRR